MQKYIKILSVNEEGSKVEESMTRISRDGIHERFGKRSFTDTDNIRRALKYFNYFSCKKSGLEEEVLPPASSGSVMPSVKPPKAPAQVLGLISKGVEPVHDTYYTRSANATNEEKEMLVGDASDGLSNLVLGLGDVKIENPKKARGDVKAPMYACPTLPIIQLNNVMAGGAHKYGYMNFRESGVDAQTYIGAIQRHLMIWQDGVDNDKESKQNHLAHIMACCAILIDCQETGNFVDNRSKTGLMEKALKKSEKTFGKYISEVRGLDDVQ